MKRALWAALAALFFCLPASAQWTTVVAGNIQNVKGDRLARGRLCFRPVDNAGNPISFTGGGGQTVSAQACFEVTNGAIPAGARVLDTAQTTPAHVCYAVTIRDTGTGKLVLGGDASPGYDCVQPTGATWNLDSYQPNLAAAPLQSNVLSLERGGTGNNAWTPARCVRVADDGSRLVAAPADCGSGGGGGGAVWGAITGTLANQGDLAAALAAKAADSAVVHNAGDENGILGAKRFGPPPSPDWGAGWEGDLAYSFINAGGTRPISLSAGTFVYGVPATRNAVGVYGWADVNSSADMAGVGGMGVDAEGYTWGASHVPFLYGLETYTESRTSGTMDLLAGVNVESNVRAPGAGAVTDSVGVRIRPQHAGTHNYALLIEDQGASDYAIKVQGGQSALKETEVRSLNGVPFAAQFASGGTGAQYNAWTSASGTGGIQEAINAAPSGGTVYLPAGFYLITAPILVTKPINLIGAGWGTVLVLANTVSATTDVFLVQPEAGGVQVNGFRFAEFKIVAQSGTPGRYGIHWDGGNREIHRGLVDHVYIGKLGSYAIYAEGSGEAQGTPVVTTIRDSVLYGGIGMSNAGDTVRILNNQITGAGPALDLSFQPGATTLLVKGNNITSDGGIHLGTAATASQFVENEIETLATFTGSHGALLDLDGAAGSFVQFPLIVRNSFQVVNGVQADSIRVNYARKALIESNRFARGSGSSHDILLTANADQSYVGNNLWGAELPFASMIADSGARTSMAFLWEGKLLIPNGLSLGTSDESGNARKLVESRTDGAIVYNGYHGTPALEASNGHSYLYDGSGHLAADFTSATSVVTPQGGLYAYKGVFHGGLSTGALATGTAPISTSSTTLNANLNADLLDSHHAAEFAPANGIGSANLAAANRTEEKLVTLFDPVASDSGRILVLHPGKAIHVTRVYCAVKAASNVVINLDKRAENTIDTDSGAHLLGSDLSCGTGGASTTTFLNSGGQCGGTTSCGIALHTPVMLTITSVTGTPDTLRVAVEYTID